MAPTPSPPEHVHPANVTLALAGMHATPVTLPLPHVPELTAEELAGAPGAAPPRWPTWHPDGAVWYLDPVPPTGRLPYKISEVPEAIRRALCLDVTRLAKPCGQFKHVYPQSGRNGASPASGWQVQLATPGTRKVYRVAMVEEPVLGALLVVATKLDRRLDPPDADPKRPRTARRVGAWLRHMVQHGDAAAQRWLGDVNRA